MRGPVVGSRSALTTLERIGREDRLRRVIKTSHPIMPPKLHRPYPALQQMAGSKTAVQNGDRFISGKTGTDLFLVQNGDRFIYQRAHFAEMRYI